MNWARLFVDGRFAYATLSMAAGRLYARLESTASDLIEQHIPHRYVPGPNHGKVEGESWQWDMRLDANGEEGILDELRRRVRAYELDRWEALLTTYDDSPVSGVYDKFLEVAVNGQADLIVTGDKDLLALDPFHSVRIVTPVQYLEKP